MNVVHITTIDQGGAYKAVKRLNDSLEKLGVETEILLRTKRNDESEGIQILTGKIEVFFSKVKNVINNIWSGEGMHIERFGTDISTKEKIINADIIIVHWINSFLSCNEIYKLNKLNKPILWVMHDMWAFTGGCHYDQYCGQYINGCTSCNRAKKESVRNSFMNKEKLFQKANVIFVGPSKWIVACAQKSKILREKTIFHIPNAIDTTIFKILENITQLKNKWNISTNKKIIMFGAADRGTKNQIKGFNYLLSALEYLDCQNYYLVIFGHVEEELNLPEKLERKYVGYIEKEQEMVELYNLADVLANPSLQEAFGYTVCEAMACGTPVVGFSVGGVKEQITHKENGYLAKCSDVQDLAKGIAYCGEHSAEMKAKARAAAERYSFDEIGNEYVDLCKKCLSYKNEAITRK